MWYILYSRVILLDFCNSNRFQSIAKKKAMQHFTECRHGYGVSLSPDTSSENFRKKSFKYTVMYANPNRQNICNERRCKQTTPPPPPKLQNGSLNHIMSIFWRGRWIHPNLFIMQGSFLHVFIWYTRFQMIKYVIKFWGKPCFIYKYDSKVLESNLF